MLTEQTRRSGSDSRGLMAVNLVAALITALLMGSSLLLLVIASAAGGGGGWLAFLTVFIIIVQMTAAMICVWHDYVPESQETMRKVMGLIQLDNDWRVPVLPVYHHGLGSGWSLCGS